MWLTHSTYSIIYVHILTYIHISPIHLYRPTYTLYLPTLLSVTYLFIYLSAHLPVWSSICAYANPPLHSSIDPSVHHSSYLSVCPPTHPPVIHPTIHAVTRPSFYFLTNPPVCLPSCALTPSLILLSRDPNCSHLSIFQTLDSIYAVPCSGIQGSVGLSPFPIAYSLARVNHGEVVRQKEKIPGCRVESS